MKPASINDEGLLKLRQFLSGTNGERSFVWPTGHPSQPTAFCPCGRPWLPRLWAYAKAAVFLSVLRGPFNAPKIALLRRRGARIGQHVYISAEVWIDPMFPELLTIEDSVMIGHGVRIALHEFGRDRFRAGRVILRRGAVIGGFALIGHGVEIGENAVVSGAAAVGRDVPAGMMAVGNPARVFPQGASPNGPASQACGNGGEPDPG
jgi:carbonic anhydrase/acetyltransferase-like protein (isoleucine patch superfamily)